MKNILYLLSLLLFTAFISCKKKAADPVPVKEEEVETGTLTIDFDHVFGEEDFVLNSSNYYITELEDSLKFTTFKYYISNIKLKKSDESYWVQSDSYYLLNCSDAASLSLSIAGIPQGDYSELTYTVGVDSTHNVSGAQTGALATTNGMYWDWNTGYVFLKSNGSYRNGTGHSGNFMHHVGGFKNSNNTNAVQTVSHDVSAEKITISHHGSEVHMMVNVATLYNGGPNDINVVSTPMVHEAGTSAVLLSQNYKQMFTIDHIHQ